MAGKNRNGLCQRKTSWLVERLADGAAECNPGDLLRLAAKAGGGLFVTGWRRAYLHPIMHRIVRHPTHDRRACDVSIGNFSAAVRNDVTHRHGYTVRPV